MSSEAAALIREANGLRQAGRLVEAAEAYRDILRRWPALADCWFNLGVVQRRAGDLHGALLSYQEALARGISKPEEVHLNRAVVYTRLHQDDAAEKELRAALDANPSYVPALLNLANLHEDRARREDARALYEQALALDPNCFLALARLANLTPPQACDERLAARLRGALREPAATAADRADLGFALGRVLDAGGQYAAAFAAYEAANRASRSSVGPPIMLYDRAAQERVTEELMAVPLPPPLPAAAAEKSTQRPIFVCGMYRSGSTLAEQLLAAHPQLAAGGELDLLPTMIASELLPFPASLATTVRSKLEQLAKRYRDRLAALFRGAAWVTDKRPDNFFCIGLIKTLFPDAKIVHTTRNALDNCLSVFFLHLDPRLTYAFDLLDTGHFYRQYRRVMAHWKRLFGSDIVDFDYDEFVGAPAPTAERLFQTLGLDWEPRFLESMNSPRGAVKTASVWQVREPIYQRSSGRARHYSRELAPLARYLADLLPAAPAMPAEPT
jgi:tetratricopeptide (TPR) repeat protein